MGNDLHVGSALSFSLLFSLSLLLKSSFVISSGEIHIINAERRIDLSSHIVKVLLTLEVKNRGTNAASEVLVAFPPTQLDHLSVLKATMAGAKKRKRTNPSLDVKPKIPDVTNGAKVFSVSLINPLSAGEVVTLEVLCIFTHSLEPFPVKISQSESQLVYYRDSAIIFTPHKIKNQTTIIRMPSAEVESYTKVEPTNHAGLELKYGPYDDQPTYTYSPILVHFENNNPFPVVEDLVREVEISHWGSIQVTEHYRLVHGGAQHKGVFSRVEYQSEHSAIGASSFKNLLMRMPPRVHSVYYRDGIGNISSSHLRRDSRKAELEIEPRYPLFGGWKSTFVIGYRVPLEDFVFESLDGRRYFNFTFGCPLLDTVVDKLIVKVVLPEGSKDPYVMASFPVKQHMEKSYSYLDMVGRTVMVVEKKNVVHELNHPFQVYYTFNPIFMIGEPLMLVSAFLAMFMACILISILSLHKGAIGILNLKRPN